MRPGGRQEGSRKPGLESGSRPGKWLEGKAWKHSMPQIFKQWVGSKEVPIQSPYFNCNKCWYNLPRSQSTSSPLTGFSQPPCHPASDVEPGCGPEPSNQSPSLAKYVWKSTEPKSEFGSTSKRSIDTINPTVNNANSDYPKNNKPQLNIKKYRISAWSKR